MTTLFVTHDQAEAMILSDRVLVMNAGRIAQDGTRRQIYEQPSSRFVMDFLGQVDHVSARVGRGPDGTYVARLEGLDRAQVPLPDDSGLGGGDGGDPRLPVRATSSCAREARRGAGAGIVVSAVYLGDRVEYVVEVGSSGSAPPGP